jgi:hypothetical protein
MRRVLFVLVGVALTAPALSQGLHYVRGHTNKSGTYVAPHFQSNSDNSRLNNWSTKGNVNPYTGNAGSIDPFAPSKPKRPAMGTLLFSTSSTSDEDPQ